MGKSNFLDTMAMVAGAVVFASGGAQGASNIRLGLGGHFKAFVVGGNQNDGPGLDERNHGVAQESETVEIGANYLGQIGSVDLAMYAGMTVGNVEGTAAALAGAGIEDQDQWGLGASLAYGGITFGADYRADDQGPSAANTDRADYSVGLSYAMGDWTIGAAYARGGIEAGFGLVQDETDGYRAGAVYALGPGVTLTGGITHWDVDDNLNAPGIGNTATVFVFGTLLSF